MKWILTYKPFKDNVEVSGYFDIPNAETWEQVQIWWRRSKNMGMKLIKGQKL